MKEGVARFAEGRSEWPTKGEFNVAGLAPLYQAINRFQARKGIAADLGLRLPPGRRLITSPRWTEPATRAALDALLDGRTTWPTNSEFRQAGLMGLCRRLNRSGTIGFWRRQYGFPKPTARVVRRQLAREAYLASDADGASNAISTSRPELSLPSD
jgi:hypothetical protein